MAGETLKERKQKQVLREAQITCALAGRKRALAKAKREQRQKKKPVDALLSRLALREMGGAVLRPAGEYLVKSHNLDKQLAGLINHLFVRYPVPEFLYPLCLADTAPAPSAKEAQARQTYRRWFITLAQGGSFPKAAKGLMTSREAAAFLSAPPERTPPENVWWAKMTVAGIPAPLAGRLIDRIFVNHAPEDPDGRLGEAIVFYAHHHAALTPRSLDEVTDFLAYTLRHDRRFRMKGRTAASAVRLSDQWHLQMQRAKLSRHIQWPGLQTPEWTGETEEEVWFATELRDNKELVNEGRKQKHCVYSYVHRCVERRSFIFSLRGYRKLVSDYAEDGSPVWDRTYETRRVTMEVGTDRTVVQVSGPLNRGPVPEEWAMLQQWALDNDIVLPGWLR